MSSERPAVIASGLSKRYVKGLRTRTRLMEKATVPDQRRPFWALRDVSFEVSAGTIAGFVGPNGAGKSTLLKILSRITPPTAGTALMFGRAASLIEVGTGFHPELTGRENVFLSAAIHGMDRQAINKRLADIIEFAGVGPFVDTPVKRYSSGMYVRLGFSVAAHVEPEILIVDEILAVGDAAFQVQCLDRVNRLRSNGTTILWVSHNLEQVQRLCDSVGLLDDGHLRMWASAPEAIARYRAIEGFADANLEGVSQVGSLDTGVEIASVEIARSSSGGLVRTGEPFAVAVTVQGPRLSQADDLNVGMWIHDAEGRLLVGTNTELLRCRLPLSSVRGLRVVFRFDYAPLRTGVYSISAAAEGAGERRYHQVVRAASLHVVDDGSTIGHVGFTPTASVEPVNQED